MKNRLLSAGVLGLGLALSATTVASGASARTAADALQYPVAELGGCADKNACKAYCDDEENLDACLAFAEKNGLMSENELAAARKFAAAGAKGPGGCSGKESCETYCNDIKNIDACIAFAEKTGILPPDELAEAKRVQAAIARGAKPPACRGKEECDAYCEDSRHMRECVAFGEASGFLQGRELEDAKKMLAAIESGVKPPPCRGKGACEAYCSEPGNMEACMAFARAAGFMTEEEAQNSEKMLQAIRKGAKPPACRGKEECDSYCSSPEHSEECIRFSVAAGFMTEKDAEVVRKTGGKGPGGCTDKESCDAFCNENRQACMDFAIENGMMSKEESAGMKGDWQEFSGSLRNMPPEVEECARAALGGDFEKIENEREMPPGVREQIGSCFSQQTRPPEGQRQNPPPEGRQGQERMMPLGEQPPEGQSFPGAYPDRMPPPEGRQFSPDSYPDQPPLDGAFAPGMYPNSPIRHEPGTEPIEMTAPQSSAFNLDSSLAAAIAAFRKISF